MTLRVPNEIGRLIEREARRRKRSKGIILREVIEAAFARGAPNAFAAEARRQSLLVSVRPSEEDSLRFVTSAADLRGWRPARKAASGARA